MFGLQRNVSEPIAAMRDRRRGRFERKPVLPGARSWMTEGPASKLAMALGYLGLVAILTMAPFWMQTVEPQQSQPSFCTDFGGSR
ncbi:MAG: hypothetical protein ACR2RA_03970 [Geminicoccaceae bacterium]